MQLVQVERAYYEQVAFISYAYEIWRILSQMKPFQGNHTYSLPIATHQVNCNYFKMNVQI